jgi:hypothetical protein
MINQTLEMQWITCCVWSLREHFKLNIRYRDIVSGIELKIMKEKEKNVAKSETYRLTQVFFALFA